MSDTRSELDNVGQLAESFLARYRRGKRPSLDEYTEKYPELAEQIRDLFPGLVVLEELGSVGGSPDDTRGAAATAVPGQLGEYRILREVGRGGMGVVYEAVQESLGRHVALKVLPFHGLIDSTQLERFRREARAAAGLHHTNIVPVFGVGEHQGIHYYAMQFIQGQGLDEVLRQVKRLREAHQKPGSSEKRGFFNEHDVTATAAYALHTGHFESQPGVAVVGPTLVADQKPGFSEKPGFLPQESDSKVASDSGLAAQTEAQYYRSVAQVGAQVAEALDHAHRQGVLHRDIKPSNLLLDTQGVVWITDFGLAKAEGSDELTQTGDIVGTLRYMAPERFNGWSDPRSDVYGLGITLYEMLTLRPAFEDSNRARLIERIVHEEPVRPRKVDASIPRDLETIVLKAIAKEATERYATAAALASDLRAFLTNRPIQARRTPLRERAFKWARRHPGVAAALALLVVAAGTAGLFAYQAWQDRQDRVASEGAARRRLLDEKMQRAQHHILQGDFPAAEQAIRDAEELGAPEEWAQWRRGQIAFHRGELEKAIQLLEPVASAMPENVAANCLLVPIYSMGSGKWDKAELILGRLDSLVPRTIEDCLYKGVAESFVDGTLGLKTLDEALARQPSLIAHMLRAQVRMDHVMDTTDLAGIEAARDDVTAAKSILRGNPSVLCASVWVHLYAAGLYAASGKVAERDAAVSVARKDAADLARFPELPYAVFLRGVFLEVDGQEEEALGVWRSGIQQKDRGILGYAYALALYRRGEIEKALEVIQHHAPVGFYYHDQTRAFFLPELADGPSRAREIYERWIAKGLVGWPRLECTQILLWLGKKDEAVAAVRAARPKLERVTLRNREWYEQVIDYLCSPGAGAAEKLLNAAGRSKRRQSDAHLYIALMLLADGDRAGARYHFQACAAIIFDSTNYALSRTFMVRMEKDSNWPPWIPAKR